MLTVITIKGFLKGIFSWIRLFPGVVFSKQRTENYLQAVKKATKGYDMVSGNSEDYYKKRYLKIIDSIIGQTRVNKGRLEALDAGCGQGRIAIEMAKRGYLVDAIDCSDAAIEKAKMYAERADINKGRINWITANLSEALSVSEKSYDFVICTEVLFMMPEDISYECLKMLAKKTKIGGVLLIAVRPRIYYMLNALMYKDFTRFTLSAHEKDLSTVGQTLSWFDPDDIEKFYLSNGFNSIRKWGIGILSGIPGDPTAFFAIPHLLSEKEKKSLADIEDKYSEKYVDTGRYMVFAAQKT